MWRLGRLILSLPLLAGCASAPEGVQVTRECGDPDGYMIREEAEFLESARFTTEWLEAHFLAKSAVTAGTELYVLAFSDRELLGRYHEPPRLVVLGLDPPEPEQWRGPAAHFFRVGGNAFFQFEDAEGRIHWRVLEGRNVLSGEVLPGVAVVYVGQAFIYYPDLELRRKARQEGVEPPNPCEEGLRSIHLVVPDWTEESIRCLADYYDALFPVPSALSILFSSDFDTAWIFGREIGLPGLEARAAGFADDRERVVGKHAHFRRVREGDKIIVRDFNRLDP